MRFDLTDLRLFTKIAEASSITAGAARTAMALPSASARIRGMEDLLGTRLLIRQRHGVTLTPAGHCLADHARTILQQTERMRADLARYASGLIGTIRLLSNTAALAEHLPGLMAPFLAAHPHLNMELEERESADIAASLASGTADIGIATAAAFSEAVETYPFRTDQLVAVMPPGHAGAKASSIRFAEIADGPLIGLPHGSALQRHLATQAARLGITLHLRARVSGFEAVCQLAAAGAGVGIVPETASRRAAMTEALAVVPLAEPWARRALVIAVRDLASLPEGSQRLVAHLRAAG